VENLRVKILVEKLRIKFEGKKFEGENLGEKVEDKI